jgi:uroporphyrin-III C-methyltransferase
MKSWLIILKICMLQQVTCLRVTFVGAGPGTSALLTEAAKAALQKAQLVVADNGVHESVLKLAASAHVSKPSAPANAMDYLQQCSSDGHDVVRLLVGDPYMSDAGRAELEACRALGLEAIAHPGISAALAAPLLAGISLTHRDVADQVWIGTGRRTAAAASTLVPTFKPRLSLVMLSSEACIPALCAELAEQHWPEDVPAAIIENAGTEAQHVVIGSLAALPRLAAEHSMQQPATLVFGDCVRVLHEGTWMGGLHQPDFDPTFSTTQAGPAVTLVGAGPGDSSLLTAAARAALAAADLVVADRLVDSSVLKLVQHCEVRTPDGKKGGAMDKTQAQIYSWVREGVQQQRRVVRLKIGDPFLYGRGGEVSTLCEASWYYSVVWKLSEQ